MQRASHDNVTTRQTRSGSRALCRFPDFKCAIGLRQICSRFSGFASTDPKVSVTPRLEDDELTASVDWIRYGAVRREQ